MNLLISFRQSICNRTSFSLVHDVGILTILMERIHCERSIDQNRINEVNNKDEITSILPSPNLASASSSLYPIAPYSIGVKTVVGTR